MNSDKFWIVNDPSTTYQPIAGFAEYFLREPVMIISGLSPLASYSSDLPLLAAKTRFLCSSETARTTFKPLNILPPAPLMSTFSLMPTWLAMEGMIQKADQVLDYAAKTDEDGVLRALFQKAKGVILISVVEGALVVSGAAGVGIMMTKDEEDIWSPPCACGMASTGWGFSMGAVIKDVIIFALDDSSVQDFTSKVGLKLGVGTSVILGTMGTTAGANVNLSTNGSTSGTINVHNLGVGGTVSIAFCQGAYVSASISGAVVGPRDAVNRAFYEEDSVSARDILFGDVEILPEKFTPVMGDVYDKLDALSEGYSKLQPQKTNSIFSSSLLSPLSLLLQGVAEESLKAIQAEEKEPAQTRYYSEIVVTKRCSSDDKEREEERSAQQLALRTLA